MDAGLKAPSSEKIPFEQTTIKGQQVPEAAVEILTEQNATPYQVNQEVRQLIKIVERDILSKLLGNKNTHGVHGDLIPGIEANNDAIERSIDNFENYASDMFTDGVADPFQDIFLSHKMQVYSTCWC